ncbi:MAG TPA: hypothetical protein VGO58_09110 [Chitinophagaceae bacterium]|jgi:hypothetical protein|nr:hypothetical protein [Chitinophagaceae bacterium]
MKAIILLTIFLFSGFIIQAQQGSWKIKLNNKTLVETRTELPQKNVRTIKASDWKKSGKLEILFTEDQKDIWFRTFYFTDEADNDLLRKDSTTHLKITLTELKKLFKGKKQINIYTTVSPVDPSIAIRMRRVHLLTLRLP